METPLRATILGCDGRRYELAAFGIGSLLLVGGFQALTIHGSQHALVLMGALLVLTVLPHPRSW